MNEDQSLEQSYTIRIVTCGQPLVGKTSLLRRLTTKTFNPNEPSTVGSEYIHFDYSVPDSNEKVHLQIWDTAGEEKYRSLAPLYFRNSNGALLVFDQTSRNTFESLIDWINLYKDSNGDDGLFFVIANKCDLNHEIIDEKKVKFTNIKNDQNEIWCCDSFIDEALNWATSNGYQFFETSAKTGEGVENLLSAIADSYIQKLKSVKKNNFTFKGRNLSKNEDCKDKCKC